MADTGESGDYCDAPYEDCFSELRHRTLQNLNSLLLGSTTMEPSWEQAIRRSRVLLQSSTSIGRPGAFSRRHQSGLRRDDVDAHGRESQEPKPFALKDFHAPCSRVQCRMPVPARISDLDRLALLRLMW